MWWEMLRNTKHPLTASVIWLCDNLILPWTQGRLDKVSRKLFSNTIPLNWNSSYTLIHSAEEIWARFMWTCSSTGFGIKERRFKQFINSFIPFIPMMTSLFEGRVLRRWHFSAAYVIKDVLFHNNTLINCILLTLECSGQFTEISSSMKTNATSGGRGLQKNSSMSVWRQATVPRSWTLHLIGNKRAAGLSAGSSWVTGGEPLMRIMINFRCQESTSRISRALSGWSALSSLP